jgi:hypothetical protein
MNDLQAAYLIGELFRQEKDYQQAIIFVVNAMLI